MDADGSFVPKKRLSCRCPAARPVRPARNFPETKKIICPAHAAHVGHMMGVWFNLSPLPQTSLFEGGGPPAGGGRSSFPLYEVTENGGIIVCGRWDALR